MKPRWTAIILFLCLITLTMSGCAREQTVYQEAGSAQQRPQATAVRQADALQFAQPEIQIDYPDDYDPYGEDEEEDIEPYLDDDDDEDYDDSGNVGFLTVPVDSAYARYAGSTPIPLDPVDMPTPTPHPELEFEYQTYNAAIGFTFEAPVGWIVDRDDRDGFVIRDPEVHDNVEGTISLTRTDVSTSFRASDLRGELTKQLNDIQRHYLHWQIWKADSRKLLNSDGIYNIYRGETYGGTVVRGLVHLALVNRSLIALQFTAPAEYNTSYQRVYNKIRQTIK